MDINNDAFRNRVFMVMESPSLDDAAEIGLPHALHTFGKLAPPARRDDREETRAGARRAFAGRGEDIGPHVDHR
jgi:hypothetical protein